MNRDLRPLLEPRSIAVVGASETSRAGTNLVRNLLELGYAGRIYPVNPRYEQVLGLPCYPSVAAIPDDIESVAVGVAAKYVLPSLEEAVRKGARGAVITSTGFAESGDEGRQRQAELVDLARRHNLAVCGPNCMGLISFANRQAMYIGDVPGRAPGRVGGVFQSGSVAIALLNSGRIPFSHLISSGNEAVVDAATYLRYLVEDPQTDVLLAFVEGIRSPELFLEVADRARELEKPIVVLKIGASERAAAAAFAHTGALAGSDAVQQAVFAQKGVIRVDDLDEMIAMVELFTKLSGRLPRSRHLGAITASGGQVGLLLDTAAKVGAEFPELTDATRAGLAEVLPFVPRVTNPLDAWGTGSVEQTYPGAMRLLADDANVDLLMIVQDARATDAPRPNQNPLRVARLAAELARTTPKPVVIATTVSGRLDPELLEIVADLPLLGGTRVALSALAGFTRYCELLRRPAPALQPPRLAEPRPAAKLLEAPDGPLSEAASLEVLAAYGLAAPRRALVQTPDEAAAAAERIGFPVALKACSADLPHKTELGAVRLNLADAAAVRTACAEVLANVRRREPEARIEGVLIAEMLDGVELIAGLKRDPEFGPVVLLGLGGILAELIQDVSLCLAPLTAADAAAMIDGLRGRPLLDDYRGRPPVDRQAIVEVLLGLSRLALDWRDRIAEIDLNPLIVSSRGAVAADALIVLARSTGPS